MEQATTSRHPVVDPVKLMERLAEQFPEKGHSNRLLMANVWLDPACLVPTADNARDPQPTDPGVIELGKSLAIVQLNSVQARPHPHTVGRFDLRAGCRRRAAAIAAGLPIRVDIYDWDDEAAFAVTMAENHDRQDLTVLEEAKLCAVCLERYSVEDSADRLGHSANWIRRRAALSRLTEEARAFGTEDWTISYWEALAVLEPDAQRDVVEQLGRWNDGVEDVSLADVRRACKEQTRSLGTEGLWPMDHPWPERTCMQCAKRKLALASLPGFEPEGTDECLDATCYDQRLRSWTRQRVEELRKEADKGAPVLVDYRMRGVIKGAGVTEESWQYHEQQTSYATKPVQVIVACDGPPRIETRYMRAERPSSRGGGAMDPKPDRETLQRWKNIKIAVIALQEDLKKASEGKESPASVERLAATWLVRGNGSAILDSPVVLLVAAAAFGVEGYTRSGRQVGWKTRNVEPVFGKAADRANMSAWHPFDCLARPGQPETYSETLAGAQEHLFRSLCTTLAGRLFINTLKADAENALVEAQTVCEFLGLEWSTYAGPAGLEG